MKTSYKGIDRAIKVAKAKVVLLNKTTQNNKEIFDKLSDKDIRNLVLHVGDHAGAQGHTKNRKLEYGQCCPGCIKLMRKLFPKNNW